MDCTCTTKESTFKPLELEYILNPDRPMVWINCHGCCDTVRIAKAIRKMFNGSTNYAFQSGQQSPDADGYYFGTLKKLTKKKGVYTYTPLGQMKIRQA